MQAIKSTRLWKYKWRFIIGTPIVSYASNYFWEKHHATTFLQGAIDDSLVEGAKTALKNPPRRILVLLNPVANGGYASQSYERAAKPVFDCAGVNVVLKKTEYVKHERDIASEIKPEYDAIVIAGGDSMLQNFLTGLNRRKDYEDFKDIPLGILPLGKTNHVWHQFSSRAEGSWQAPYTRPMRITEAAKTIVANSKRKVNVLSLTDSSERTLYTLSGIRWGKYIDMEGRLDSYWYFGFEALKRKAAYVMANFRGEIDEMRNIQLNFGEPLSQAQAKENAETDAWRTQREKSMKRSSSGKGFFGFSRAAPAAPPSTFPKEADQVKTVDLDKTETVDFFEMNLAVNHEDARRHLVEFCFERKFDKSNLLSLLLPFVNDPISTRSGAFGQVKELDVHKLETSDFDLTPGQAIAKFNSEEESKDYSFFIDGESFIPSKLKGRLLLDHMSIFSAAQT